MRTLTGPRQLLVIVLGVTLLTIWGVRAAAEVATDPGGISTENEKHLRAAKVLSVPLDLIVLLDRSGSMAESGKWAATVAGLTDFFDGPIEPGTSVGLTFFPEVGIPDQCDPVEFDPATIPLGELPGHSTTLVAGLSSQTPTGDSTPTYSALLGSLQFAINVGSYYPSHVVAVVLVTDGSPNECETATAEFTSIAFSAFNCCFVRTYVVGLPGSSTTFLTAIAGAGGTGEAYILDDSALVGDVMGEIRLDALGIIFTDSFELGDTTAWSSAVP